jgi:hypothetical protein
LTGSDSPPRFVHRYLDPGERLGEILFGLIMVLTFTSTARAALGDDPNAGRQVMIAAIGCNIAWGIIDGGMYIMHAMLRRAHEAQAEARARGGSLVPTRLTMDDLKGAAACFWLVVACTIPASVPFMLFEDPYVAVRTSNALLLGMLFVAGFMWGGHANTNRWGAGLVFLAVGLILVAIAIVLGG